MKVLHIAQSLGGGGKERRLLQLLVGMKDNPSYEVTLVLLKNAMHYQEVNDLSINILVIKETNRLGVLMQLRNIILKEKPDIIHSWIELPSAMLFLSIWKYFMHYKLIIALANANPISSFLYKNVYGLTFKASDAVVSNSQAGIVAKKVPPKKSYVIYNGFDFSRFKDISSINIERVKAQFSIHTRYVVTMFARFHSARDYMSFINMAEYIGKYRSDITFLGVGMGDMLQLYQKEVVTRKLENIRLGGFVQDITQLLAITDVSVLFTSRSVQEGLSNSIMESMAAGRPVIATKSGGTPEIIKNGINGFIVEPEDYIGAGQLLFKMIDDNNLYCGLSENAIKTVKSKFLLSDMVANYRELYNRIVDD